MCMVKNTHFYFGFIYTLEDYNGTPEGRLTKDSMEPLPLNVNFICIFCFGY